MKRRLAVVVARAARAARGLWPDHNPLRRGVDRAEAATVGGLGVAFLAMAPLVAMTAFHVASSVGTRIAHAQHSWHQTAAVLLANAPGSWESKHLASAPGSWESKYGAPVPVRWVAPDGTPRTTAVPVPLGAKAGSTVTVWLDASGQPTGGPIRLSQVQGQAALAAALSPVALGMLLAAVGLLARSALGRRRMAAWERDWQATEPQWTRRR